MENFRKQFLFGIIMLLIFFISTTTTVKADAYYIVDYSLSQTVTGDKLKAEATTYVDLSWWPECYGHTGAYAQSAGRIYGEVTEWEIIALYETVLSPEAQLVDTKGYKSFSIHEVGDMHENVNDTQTAETTMQTYYEKDKSFRPSTEKEILENYNAIKEIGIKVAAVHGLDTKDLSYSNVNDWFGKQIFENDDISKSFDPIFFELFTKTENGEISPSMWIDYDQQNIYYARRTISGKNVLYTIEWNLSTSKNDSYNFEIVNTEIK